MNINTWQRTRVITQTDECRTLKASRRKLEQTTDRYLTKLGGPYNSGGKVQ